MKHMRTFNPVSDGREFPMNHEVQVYESPEFSKIRAVMLEGKPWFIAKDVCDCLGTATKDLPAILDEDEKGVDTIDTLGGPQQMTVISEPGLYSLVLRSRKPKAKAFKRWVTHDVLPSIRKTGAYTMAGGWPAVSDIRKYFDRIDMNSRTVDPEHFCVFHEIAQMAPELLHAKVPLDEHTMPDISVGILWGKHWQDNNLDEKYGPRSQYGHVYPSYFPQAKCNPVEAWQYPLDALPEFHRWLRGSYIPVCFPRYMQNKVKGKSLPASVAQQAVEAFLGKQIAK